MPSNGTETQEDVQNAEDVASSENTDGLKLSRRSFIKAGVAGAAVVGVGLTLKDTRGSSLAVSSSTSSASDPFAAKTIILNVNGVNYDTVVEPRDMLVNVLRENLGLIGTKRPCNRMECGGCTVLIDNVPYYSCTYLAVRAAQGQKILTVEGGSVDSVLKTLQAAWVTNDASQCGYCQPGRIMAATALLKNNSNPSVAEIQAGLEGVLCRCGTYVNVIEAVQAAAKNL